MSTPLNIAISQSHIDAIHLLLDHGAEVTEHDLEDAFEHKIDEDMIKRLMDHNCISVHYDMMDIAIHKYSANICLDLLYRKSPKWWNEHEINPLHILARSRHYALVTPFVDYGIDINKISHNNYTWKLKGVMDTSVCTPSHIAACYLNIDMVEELFNHGADMTIKDYNNRTTVDILKAL